MAKVDPEFATAVEVSEHLLAVTEQGIMQGQDALFICRQRHACLISRAPRRDAA